MNNYGEDMRLAAINIEGKSSEIQAESQKLYLAIQTRNLSEAITSVAHIARMNTDIDLQTVKIMELLSFDHSETSSEARKHIAMWATRIRSADSVDDATRLLQSFAIQTMEAALNRTIDTLTNIVGITQPEEE